MVLICPLAYEGNNLAVNQLKQDITEFIQPLDYRPRSGYEWVSEYFFCELPDEMMLTFILKHPEHADKVYTDMMGDIKQFEEL
jgi:hypothetical protein